jgi:hypothetical protein
VFGGVSSLVMNDFYCADLEAKKWRQVELKATLTPPRLFAHSLNMMNENTGFVFGGCSEYLNKAMVCQNSLFKLDLGKPGF